MGILLERKAQISNVTSAHGCASALAHLLVLAIMFFMLASLRSPAVAEPVITVSLGGANTRLQITRSMLQDMPETNYTTSTVWTEAVDTYTGVLLYDFLEALSVDVTTQNGQIVFKALDDYKVLLPFADIDRVAPMIAFLKDDAVLSLRDQGPFWLIWPYDLSSQYRTEAIYARSIWHIVSMDIEF